MDLYKFSLGWPIFPLVITYWIIRNVGGVEALAKTPIVVPVSQLIEGRSVPITHSYVSTYPDWVNLTLLRIGQSFLYDNVIGVTYGLGVAGSVGCNPDLTRVVIDIGNLTNFAYSMRRFLLTALNEQYWSVVDPIKDSDNFFEALNLMHALHARVGAQAFAKAADTYSKPVIPNPKHGSNPYKVNLKAWAAFEMDLKASKLKGNQIKPLLFDSTSNLGDGSPFHAMNQLALTSVLWVIVSSPILTPENLFIYSATEEQFLGFLHLWAFIGHAFGIQDQYNICFQPNLAAAKLYFKELFQTYFLPYLFQLDYEFKYFAETTFSSFLSIVPIEVDTGFLLLRVCTILLDIECPELRRSLSFQERFYNNLVFGRLAHSLVRLHPVKSSLRFIAHGLVQRETLRIYNFNTLLYDNFTAGLLTMNEKILPGSSTNKLYHVNNNNNDI